MIIERTVNEIIFSLPATMDIDELQYLSDLFQYKEIAAKSKATQEDVDNLVSEIKKGRWQKAKNELGRQ